MKRTLVISVLLLIATIILTTSVMAQDINITRTTEGITAGRCPVDITWDAPDNYKGPYGPYGAAMFLDQEIPNIPYHDTSREVVGRDLDPYEFVAGYLSQFIDTYRSGDRPHYASTCSVGWDNSYLEPREATQTARVMYPTNSPIYHHWEIANANYPTCPPQPAAGYDGTTIQRFYYPAPLQDNWLPKEDYDTLSPQQAQASTANCLFMTFDGFLAWLSGNIVIEDDSYQLPEFEGFVKPRPSITTAGRNILYQQGLICPVQLLCLLGS